MFIVLLSSTVPLTKLKNFSLRRCCCVVRVGGGGGGGGVDMTRLYCARVTGVIILT